LGDVPIDSAGCVDAVGRVSFARPCSQVSILWGDPVGVSGGGGRAREHGTNALECRRNPAAWALISVARIL